MERCFSVSNADREVCGIFPRRENALRLASGQADLTIDEHLCPSTYFRHLNEFKRHSSHPPYPLTDLGYHAVRFYNKKTDTEFTEWVRAGNMGKAVVDIYRYYDQLGLAKDLYFEQVCDYRTETAPDGSPLVPQESIRLGLLHNHILRYLDNRNADLVSLFIQTYDGHSLGGNSPDECERRLFLFEVLYNTDPEGKLINGYCHTEDRAELSTECIKKTAYSVWGFFMYDALTNDENILSLLHQCEAVTSPELLFYWTCKFLSLGDQLCPFPHALYRRITDGTFTKFYASHKESRHFFFHGNP